MKSLLAAFLTLSVAMVPAQQSSKAGGSSKIAGSATMAVAQGVAPSGSTVPLGDPPLAGAPTSCSSKYEGVYEYGLYNGCTDEISTGPYKTALAAAAAAITPLNTSGTTSGCPTSCAVIVVGTGMSVALAEFNQYLVAANASGLQKSTIFNSNQAFSNNDLPLWTVSTPGTPPPPCLTTGNAQNCGGTGPSFNCTAVSGGGTGTECNEFDFVATRIPSGGHTLLQIQFVWHDTSNGQEHGFMNGCCPVTGTLCDQNGPSTVYQVCSVLDGVHAIDGGSTCSSLSSSCITLVNTIDATNTLYEVGEQVRAEIAVWPNELIAAFSSRVYGGYCHTGCADPYPYEYEKAFAFKALIHAQRCEMGDDGCTLGTKSTVAGDLCPPASVFPSGCGAGTTSGSAPLLMWADVQADASDDATIHSGYFWANDDLLSYNSGNGRFSDGLAWCNSQSGYCGGAADFAPPDFLHLTTAGATKAGNLLLAFFEHSPYTKPWWHV